MWFRDSHLPLSFYLYSFFPYLIPDRNMKNSLIIQNQAAYTVFLHINPYLTQIYIKITAHQLKTLRTQTNRSLAKTVCLNAHLKNVWISALKEVNTLEEHLLMPNTKHRRIHPNHFMLKVFIDRTVLSKYYQSRIKE